MAIGGTIMNFGSLIFCRYSINRALVSAAAIGFLGALCIVDLFLENQK